MGLRDALMPKRASDIALSMSAAMSIIQKVIVVGKGLWMENKMSLYRCKYCRKIISRESDKQWIKSFCDKEMKMVHITRIDPDQIGFATLKEKNEKQVQI